MKRLGIWQRSQDASSCASAYSSARLSARLTDQLIGSGDDAIVSSVSGGEA